MRKIVLTPQIEYNEDGYLNNRQSFLYLGARYIMKPYQNSQREAGFL